MTRELRYPAPDGYRQEIDEASNYYWDCEHPNTKIRVRTNSAGAKMVGKQCLDCGRVSGGRYLKKSDYPNASEPWDEDLEANSYNKYRNKISEITEKYIEIQNREDEDKRKAYEEYLKTDRWKDKRNLVLERDNYICCACRRRSATQVHHLTYQNLFNEPLFELVSVCDICHEHLHPWKNDT